jgi:hypothetical protein
MLKCSNVIFIEEGSGVRVYRSDRGNWLFNEIWMQDR